MGHVYSYGKTRQPGWLSHSWDIACLIDMKVLLVLGGWRTSVAMLSAAAQAAR